MVGHRKWLPMFALGSILVLALDSSQLDQDRRFSLYLKVFLLYVHMLLTQPLPGFVTLVIDIMPSFFPFFAALFLLFSLSATGTLRGACITGYAFGFSLRVYLPGIHPIPSKTCLYFFVGFSTCVSGVTPTYYHHVRYFRHVAFLIASDYIL